MYANRTPLLRNKINVILPPNIFELKGEIPRNAFEPEFSNTDTFKSYLKKSMVKDHFFDYLH